MAGWKRVKIEDVFEETCEKNHPYAEVLTIIQGVGTVPREQSGREIVYDKNSLANYKFVKKGDFIIHLRSFEGGLEVANSDGIVSPAYIILHPKIEVSTKFLYALFHTNRFINQTMPPAVEGARDGRSVKYDVLKKQKILFPPLLEQKKIAEILATQDRVIELKEKLIAEKQSQKKYLMSVLLGDDFKKPFKLNGVTIDKKKWEKKKLGELLEFKNGVNVERDKIGFGTKMISVMDILSDKPITYDVIRNSVALTKDELSIYDVRYGDVLFQRSSENYDDAGMSNIYVDENKCATFSGFVIRGKKIGEYNPYCLNAILRIPSSRRKIMKKAAGAQHVNIGQDALATVLISLPSLPEQKAIAEVLSVADEEISLLQKSLEQEKLKKKSLMQLLLTGLVRVQ